MSKERVEVPIILDGRFVLDGTLQLNAPFQNEEEEELTIRETDSELTDKEEGKRCFS